MAAYLKHLEFLRELFTSFFTDTEQDEDRPRDEFAWFFSRDGLGSIWLKPDERAEFLSAVQRLSRRYGPEGQISRRTVERALGDALLSAFGKPGQEEPPFEDRLEAALDDLHRMLGRPSVTYTCFLPIGGTSGSGLPFYFGKFRFVVFNDSQLRKFRASAHHHSVSPEQLDLRLRTIGELRDSDLWLAPCAVRGVKAKDPEAARSIVEADLPGTLDALNFFSDLTPYQSGRVFVLGERGQAAITAATLGDDHSFSLPRRLVGPSPVFEFAKLRATAHLSSFVRRVHDMLRTEAATEVIEILLSAVRWAGRAACEPRPEQAFLWYAISLESAVIPADTQELGYRLRLRVAHLLAESVHERVEMMERVKKLYTIRSKIVHSGWYEVPPGDLEALRSIAKEVVLKLLTEPSVRRLSSKRELEEWFEARVLA